MKDHYPAAWCDKASLFIENLPGDEFLCRPWDWDSLTDHIIVLLVISLLFLIISLRAVVLLVMSSSFGVLLVVSAAHVSFGSQCRRIFSLKSSNSISFRYNIDMKIIYDISAFKIFIFLFFRFSFRFSPRSSSRLCSLHRVRWVGVIDLLQVRAIWKKCEVREV